MCAYMLWASLSYVCNQSLGGWNAAWVGVAVLLAGCVLLLFMQRRPPVRIKEARSNATKAGVGQQVKFVNADLFKTDLSDASVVTLYLLNSVNRNLRPQLWRQLKVGTRVVSHAFDMGQEWPPERTERVDGRAIYSWTITEANKRAAMAAPAPAATATSRP